MASIGSILYLFFLFIIHLLWGERVFPFNPEVDTEYSISFNEKNFDRIKLGMNVQDVDSIIGDPIERVDITYDPVANGLPEGTSMRFDYSKDGNCSWGDFAWFHYALFLDSNYQVVKIIDGVVCKD